MTHEEKIEQILDKYDYWNLEMEEDLILLLKDEREQAFRDVFQCFDGLTYQPYKHPISTLNSEIKGFREAIEKEDAI